MLQRRLPPEAWYPAGDPVARARRVRLPSGLEARIVEAGPADGAPVVLVHGWACSAYSFRHQLPSLAAAGYHAVALDLKGHGLSDKPDVPTEYTAQAMTRFVAEVVQALGLDQVALVGHSLGGGIATRAVLDGRVEASRLAVVSAIGFGRVPVLPLLRFTPELLVDRMLPVVMPRWLYGLVLRGVVGRRRPVEAPDLDQYWAASQFAEYQRAAWQLVKRFHWEALLPEEQERLQLPVLAIFGDRDRVVRRGGRDDVSSAVTASASRGGTEVHVLPDVGHMPLEEAPDEVNALLLDFLAPWKEEWEAMRGGARASAGEG